MRYYFLLPIYLLFSVLSSPFAITTKAKGGSKLSLTPRWMGSLVFLQPATLEYMRDVVIDDERARRVLGYVLLYLLPRFLSPPLGTEGFVV